MIKLNLFILKFPIRNEYLRLFLKIDDIAPSNSVILWFAFDFQYFIFWHFQSRKNWKSDSNTHPWSICSTSVGGLATSDTTSFKATDIQCYDTINICSRHCAITRVGVPSNIFQSWNRLEVLGDLNECLKFFSIWSSNTMDIYENKI